MLTIYPKYFEGSKNNSAASLKFAAASSCVAPQEFIPSISGPKGGILYISVHNKGEVLGLSDGAVSADAQTLHRDCTEVAQRMHGDCPDFARKTYEYLCSNPYATIKEMSEKLDISIRTVNNHISALKKTGLIERIGSDTSGHWIIKNN